MASSGERQYMTGTGERRMIDPLPEVLVFPAVV